MYCRRLLIATTFALTTLCLSPTLSQAAPPVTPPIQEYAVDVSMFKHIHDNMHVLDISEFDDDLPRKVDYSEYVTFTRCQDWGGGCMVYAAMHITDVLKEWEHPYTPDLSWRYVQNTFLDIEQAGIDAQGNAYIVPDLLSSLFEAGIAPEGLCRTELDLLTPVYRKPGTPLANDQGTSIRDYLPDPSAEATVAAQLYKASVSGPITPTVKGLRAMLHHYGPIWAAGGWWSHGGHAMAFVGYDDDTREFRFINSQGDWWGSDHGFGTISYDNLIEYVSSLRIVTNTPAPQPRPDQYAYSARIRITGVWRGTHTISIGVVGREPIVVWRTHGRMKDRVFEYGDRLTIDVPLPDYAPQCWPPSATNRWTLRVEDNDRDNAHGTLREFTLARRYSAPTCKSIGRIQTETYGGAMNVALHDPSTGPVYPTRTRSNHFVDWHAPNPNPGVTEVQVPAQDTPLIAQMVESGQYAINMPPADWTVNEQGKPVMHGQLLHRATAFGPWQPVPNRRVSLHRLKSNACVNMPAQWMRQGTRKTNAAGRFEFVVKNPPPLLTQHFWAAGLKGANDQWLASSEITTLGIDKDKLTPQFHEAIPEIELPFPDLRAPMQDIIRPMTLRQNVH